MFIFRPWKIGKVMGIPISIDPSWLIVFGLLTYTLATEVFPFELRPRRSFGLNSEALVLAVIASLLLFASVLAHELSHAWMARRRGIPVLGITLFIFGGLAQIADEPDRPATEFWVSIMGPLMSFALATLFGAAWIWSTAIIALAPPVRLLLLPIAIVGGYLAQANLLLVLFNLLPGFPLDGGRVLRALLWALLHELERATQVAMVVGRGIALLMITFGLALVIGLNLIGGSIGLGVRADLNGIWFVFIGGFLWQAAGEAYRSVLLRSALKGVAVGRLMQPPVGRVTGELSVNSFVADYLLRARPGAFAVEDNGVPIGIVGQGQLRKIPRTGWNRLLVRQVMLPLSAALSLAPEDSALRAMQQLMRLDGTGEELPVVQAGQVVGIVGHDEIARYLQWKSA